MFTKLLFALCGTIGPTTNRLNLEGCENFGKLEAMGLQRLRKDDGTLNSMTLAEVKVLATYTLLQAASDSTRFQLTPRIQSPSVTAGETIKARGGNDSQDGIQIPVGTEPTEIVGQMLRQKQGVIEQLKGYSAESSNNNLGFFGFNNYGHMIVKVDDVDNPQEFYPIPIQGFNVKDKEFGGKLDVDNNGIEFSLPANWSDKTVVLTDLAFDVFTALRANGIT